jgi:hypothetical protein
MVKRNVDSAPHQTELIIRAQRKASQRKAMAEFYIPLFVQKTHGWYVDQAT